MEAQGERGEDRVGVGAAIAGQRLAHMFEAALHRDAVAGQQKAVNQSKTPDELVKKELSQRLSAEVAEGIPKTAPDLYKDLIFSSTKDVNWECRYRENGSGPRSSLPCSSRSVQQ